MNTLSSAKEFAKYGKIHNWIQHFLREEENKNI